MTIKSKQELKNKLDEIAIKSLEKVAIKVRDTWMGYIQTEFYDQYIPQKYIRTDQLLNSIREIVTTDIYETSNGWAIDVFMDESTAQWGYGKYSSEDLGRIEPMDVWKSAADGWHGGVRKEGRFYDAIINDLENGKIRNDFEKILKNVGLKLTVKH